MQLVRFTFLVIVHPMAGVKHYTNWLFTIDHDYAQAIAKRLKYRIDKCR